MATATRPSRAWARTAGPAVALGCLLLPLGMFDAMRILDEESGTHLWEPAVRALLRSLGGREDGRAVA